MSRLRPVVFGCEILLLSLVSSQARADAPAWQKPLSDMFDAGWRFGAEAHNAAEDHYHAAQKLAGSDERVEYGWALVLLKQRRNEAAVAQLDSILKKNPNHLSALAWKVRLRLNTRKFPEAVVGMETMAKAAGTSLENAKQPAARAEGLAAARFLGRAFGYLEGPAELKASQREELLAAVQQPLPSDAVQAFETARAGVNKQFGDLQRQGELHKAEDQEKESQGKKQAQTQVDMQRANLEQEVSDIAAERTKIQTDQRQELADVSREARRADTVVSQAESRLAAVLRQWNLLQGERLRWQSLFDTERDPARREIYRSELANIDITLGTIDADRRLRDADLVRARMHRGDIEQQRVEVQRRYQGQLAGLEKRDDGARQAQRRLGGQQKKIDKPVSDHSARQRNLNVRAATFSTYEDSSLDMEKARLLSSVK